MVVSYKKLWKLLIDRDMKKLDLSAAANVSTSSMAKMGRGENINTDLIVRICNALNCKVEDIMEVLPDKKVDE
ncbi:MAG: helix-turn-helix transcriptional regulator [Clostridiales bacterium]|nr:helix-turn-helix transcriptional regulator [Clostridiales bacterium]